MDRIPDAAPEEQRRRIREALTCGNPRCECSSADGDVHCPAHADQHPSFGVDVKGGRVVYHCRTGCSQTAVTEELRARQLVAAVK